METKEECDIKHKYSVALPTNEIHGNKIDEIFFLKKYTTTMAAPMEKICVTCFGIIKNRSYRMLNSESSINQWGHIFQQLSVNLIGCVCNFCTNKLNRICRLTDESKTKAQALLIERDRIVSELKELPGVKQGRQSFRPKHFSTPLSLEFSTLVTPFIGLYIGVNGWFNTQLS